MIYWQESKTMQRVPSRARWGWLRVGFAIVGWVGIAASFPFLTIAQQIDSNALTRAEKTMVKMDKTDARQFYELRVYKVFDFEKQQALDRYLELALLPALKRQQIDMIGAFHRADDENDHSIFLLIPFSSLDQWAACREKLASDPEYQQAASEYFAAPLKDPWYERIDTRLLRAMTSLPQLMRPQTPRVDRVYELRLYESHTEDHARRKVEMFNVDEIRVMQEAGLGPVFFSETMIGRDVPNLVYMLSSESQEQHEQAWKNFLAHPDWIRIKDLEVYRDTVSKIEKWMLKATTYSQWSTISRGRSET